MSVSSSAHLNPPPSGLRSNSCSLVQLRSFQEVRDQKGVSPLLLKERIENAVQKVINCLTDLPPSLLKEARGKLENIYKDFYTELDKWRKWQGDQDSIQASFQGFKKSHDQDLRNEYTTLSHCFFNFETFVHARWRGSAERLKLFEQFPNIVDILDSTKNKISRLCNQLRSDLGRRPASLPAVPEAPLSKAGSQPPTATVPIPAAASLPAVHQVTSPLSLIQRIKAAVTSVDFWRNVGGYACFSYGLALLGYQVCVLAEALSLGKSLSFIKVAAVAFGPLAGFGLAMAFFTNVLFSYFAWQTVFHVAGQNKIPLDTGDEADLKQDFSLTLPNRLESLKIDASKSENYVKAHRWKTLCFTVIAALGYSIAAVSLGYGSLVMGKIVWSQLPLSALWNLLRIGALGWFIARGSEAFLSNQMQKFAPLSQPVETNPTMAR